MHYGTLVVAALGLGLFIPPFGVGFFIACALGRTNVESAARAYVPYVVVLLIGLLLVAFVPSITLIVPAAHEALRGEPMLHTLRATPETCFWGFFDAALPPVLRVRSGDLVRIETLTHQAGDAPDLMMDAGVKAVYDAIPIATRGPGVHVMTGPIHVEGAEPGDTLEIRVLSMEPRLAYGTNIAAWWGHLYDDFGKERITIYRIDAAAGLARAAFAFDYTTTPRYEQPGIIVPPDAGARQPALANVVVPLRPHFGVGGRRPARGGQAQQHPARRVRRQRGQLALRAGRGHVLPGLPPGRALLPGRPAHGRGRRGALRHRHRGLGQRGRADHRCERTCG